MTPLAVARFLSLQQVDLEMISSLVPRKMIGSGEMDIIHSKLITKQQIIVMVRIITGALNLKTDLHYLHMESFFLSEGIPTLVEER